MKSGKLNLIALIFLSALSMPAISGCTYARSTSSQEMLLALRDLSGNLLPDDQTNSDAIDWRLVSASESKMHGIGSFESKDVTCSATLIDAGGGDDAQANLLTAAHCYSKPDGSLLEPNEIISGVSARDYTFYPNNFHDSPDPFSDPIAAQAVRYATMKGTDVMIVSISATVGMLKKRGLQAFKIASREARIGESLTIYGVPTSGIDDAHNGLHETHCKVEGQRFQKSRLGNSGSPKTYVLRKALVERCSSTGGVSGGPVFSADHEILAVVSNSKQLAQASQLTAGTDLTETQKQFVWNNLGVVGAAAEVSKLAGCFDVKGNFDIALPSCQLEKPCSDSSDATACAADKCAAGDGAACFDQVAQEPEKPTDRSELLARLDKGCSLHDGPSCESLGTIYAREQDSMRALPLLNEACGLSQQSSCGIAAYLTEEANGDVYTPEARALAVKGCLGMDGLACRLAGAGTRPDDAQKALGYYLTGCTYGDKTSCVAAGQLFEQNVLGSKAPVFAQKLYTLGGKLNGS